MNFVFIFVKSKFAGSGVKKNSNEEKFNQT